MAKDGVTANSKTIGKDSNDISSHTVIDLTATDKDGKVTIKDNNLSALKVTK